MGFHRLCGTQNQISDLVQLRRRSLVPPPGDAGAACWPAPPSSPAEPRFSPVPAPNQDFCGLLNDIKPVSCLVMKYVVNIIKSSRFLFTSGIQPLSVSLSWIEQLNECHHCRWGSFRLMEGGKEVSLQLFLFCCQLHMRAFQ